MGKEAIPSPSHDMSETVGVSHCFPLLLMRQGKFIQELTISAFTSAVEIQMLEGDSFEQSQKVFSFLDLLSVLQHTHACC